MMNPVKPLPLEDLEHVLLHTGKIWEPLRGGRLFVTGATGFFGMWLLETFAFANERLNLGAQLVGLTRNPEAFRAKAPHLAANPAITLHQGDVRHFDFPSGNFSHVIHAGTTSSVPVPPKEMLETIIQGTTRTLDCAVASGVKRFLFVSSGAVYGKQPQDLTHIPETYTGAPDTTDPASAYGEGKRVGELLCSIFNKQHGLETVITRCFAFVGPHLPLNGHFAAGNFIRDALGGGPIHVKGDGSPVRSYLYAADLAIWLWTILLRGQHGRSYNVGLDIPIKISQLADAAALACASHAGTRILGNLQASDKLEVYLPNINRARNELGLDVFTPLEESLRRTALHYSQLTNE
jgi:dTDP-glucose 4,6-dehydratase